jgi:hypothetical protein
MVPQPQYTDTAWHDVVLQHFPDGACGLAIDGEPLAIVNGDPPSADSLRVVVQGNSYRTRILIGPLEVIEGVVPGIDWTKAPRLR